MAWMRKERKKFNHKEEDEVGGLWLVGSAGVVHDKPVDSRRDEEKGGRRRGKRHGGTP